MSHWTSVIASYEVETFKASKRIKTIVRKAMKNAPEITGSEGPAEVFINFPSGYNVSCFYKGKVTTFQTHFIITIVGHLRDRLEESVKRDIKEFEHFLDKQDWRVIMRTKDIGW